MCGGGGGSGGGGGGGGGGGDTLLLLLCVLVVTRCDSCLCISIDQLGVPRSVAMALTLPEVVTPFNIGALQELVRNGPNELAGAKYVALAACSLPHLLFAFFCHRRYVVRDDDSRLDLRYKAPGDVHLELGYRVRSCIVIVIVVHTKVFFTSIFLSLDRWNDICKMVM